MDFVWDAAKDRINAAKHGVTFGLARRVWDDPSCLVVFDRIVDGEDRWHAIGICSGVVMLTVVHMYPDGDEGQTVRIISARKATRWERERYEDF
jgi:uncharacterized protein